MVRKAKSGQYRTIVPKKGVYIHVKKTKKGKMVATKLRRTKAHARRTRKPRVQKIRK
ncbi:MAG: hypothetical protein J7K29_03130 [Candidatus Cloacimonetes bacterium]|nr:hypothetical protein [Candidatus Cloacimonadota bacterium]